jgi:hypothetical protein
VPNKIAIAREFRDSNTIGRGRGRFVHLLVSLILMLSLLPLFPHEPYAHVVSAALLTLVIATGTQAVMQSRVFPLLGLCIAVPTVIGQWLTFSLNLGFVAEFIYHLFIIAFLGVAIWTVLVAVLGHRRVTTDTMCGAASVYLLMGLMGACLLSAAELAHPGSIWIDPVHASPELGIFPVDRQVIASDFSLHGPQDVRLGQPGFALLTYFSFMTLTTVGYGDVYPSSPIARTLCMLLATSGQLYLAILIARLVGLHIATSSGRDKSSNAASKS